ncbi:Hypothetical predicted protein [Octopus vulgaris]|uniref:Uncharacterized protein n=1 Tax=Octopus vulgaris TaxID=6645 RepID=A0AA36B1V9_OCTVU|nr:Hypothetical predicted protein [Octopus vulgaris]
MRSTIRENRRDYGDEEEGVEEEDEEEEKEDDAINGNHSWVGGDLTAAAIAAGAGAAEVDDDADCGREKAVV